MYKRQSLDGSLDKGKTETKALDIVAVARMDPIKLIKDMSPILPRDTNPVVLYIYD